MLDDSVSTTRANMLLQARAAELEARLVEVTRCLEAAESRAARLLEVIERAELAESELAICTQLADVRAAELAVTKERAESAEYWLAQVTGSGAWRLITALRGLAGRLGVRSDR